jgi:hypothetical protein
MDTDLDMGKSMSMETLDMDMGIDIGILLPCILCVMTSKSWAIAELQHFVIFAEFGKTKSKKSLAQTPFVKGQLSAPINPRKATDRFKCFFFIHSTDQINRSYFESNLPSPARCNYSYKLF